MNKKLISAAVMLGVSGAATAVNVNPDGLGQVLLYPYYTTNNGLSTGIHIVNTTDDTKAIKVRFSEGGNSWEIRDFNLYLSPHDAWAAEITMGEDGLPKIVTPDTSCTVLPFEDGEKTVSTVNIDTFSDEDHEPSYLMDIDAETRAAEGHVEVIEMGVVNNYDAGTPADDSDDINFADFILHADGTPADCASIVNAWDGGTWSTDKEAGISAPKGGLFGTANIISVANGIDRGYDAVAIDGFWDSALIAAGGTPHTRPGNSYPNLNGQILENDGSTTTYGSNVANVFNNGVLRTATFTRTVDALSAALMVTQIYNEFNTFAGTLSATDWVVSYPTKHFYVNQETTSGGIGQYGLLSGILVGPNATLSTAMAPFVAGFQSPISVNAFDREEETFTASQLCDSPCAAAANITLDYETNVLEFSADRNIFDSSFAIQTVPQDANGNLFSTGWAAITLGDASSNNLVGDDNGSNVTFSGQPAIGFAVTQSENGTGDQALRNYANAFAHKYSRDIN